jgi:HK97 gp10 family phage protein
MADFTFQMTGGAELIAALDELPGIVERKILQDMMMLGARDTANDFKVNAPEQDPSEKPQHPPGTGKNAIKASPAHKDGVPQGRVVLRRAGFFLSFYEFGTRHQPARPFMRPVLDASTPAILEEMVDFGAQRLDAAVQEARA